VNEESLLRFLGESVIPSNKEGKIKDKKSKKIVARTVEGVRRGERLIRNP
jgi:hypothetical protein